MRWEALPEDFVRPFVATAALAAMRLAPDDRMDVNARDGVIVLTRRNLRLDLRALAVRCAGLDREAWEREVEREVERWIAPLGDLPASFDEAAASVRIQLATYGVQPDPDTLSRALAPGLVAELCRDVPGQQRPITRAAAERWGQPEAALWALALDNLALDGASVDTFALEAPIALAFHRVHGASAFVAAHALRLAALDGRVPVLGWLFMVPNRHTLWYAPLDEVAQCAAGMLMLERARPDVLRGDGLPISDQIYWTDGAQIVHVGRDGVKTGNDLTSAIAAIVARA